MSEQTSTATEQPSRTIAIVQRIIDADRRAFQDRHHPNWGRFQRNPKARAQAYVANSLRNPVLSSLESQLQKWFNPHFKFSQLSDNWTVSPWRVKEFDEVLKIRGFIAFNTGHIRAILGDLRRAQSDDYAGFDKAVYTEDAVGLLLDAAEEHWNRNGSESLMRQAAHLLERRFGITIDLLTLEEALEHMQSVLEEYATAYEKIVDLSLELNHAAAEATNEAAKD